MIWKVMMLHHYAASARLLRRVRVVSLVDLQEVVSTCILGMYRVQVRGKHTVPQRLGTMKSLGSLSVKAMRLSTRRCQRHSGRAVM